MGSASVTLADVATHLGVSRTTVSNAYNRPNQLSPKLREKVLAAAGELGYCGPDGLPFVPGEGDDHPTLAHVQVDEIAGAAAAARHVTAHGHRRVAIVSP